MQSQTLQELLGSAAPASENQELGALVQYIRRILPDQKQLTRVHVSEESRFVEFTWHRRHFVVRPNLNVLELKGKTVMITGISQLMQAALRTKDRNAKVLGAVIENIKAAEDNMQARPEDAFFLLKQTKEALLKLAGKAAAKA